MSSGFRRRVAITPMLPPTSGRDIQGANMRFGMFLSAIGDENGPVTILRLVPQAVIDMPENAAAVLDEKESSYWGRKVRVALIARRTRRETWVNHYLAGMVRAADQKNLYPYGGLTLAQALAARLDPENDLIFIHKLPAMCAFLHTRLRPRAMFFDLDDVEHRVRFRLAVQKPVWPGKLIYATHAPALLTSEKKGAALSRATFVCSKRDRDHLTRLGVKRVAVVPNGVKLPRSVPGTAAGKTILYIGLMTYEPNIEAARRLIDAIMPLVWRKCPEARLLLAGEGSQAFRGAGTDQRVECLGFVPDLDDLYAKARIICCPLKNGGGTRVKLLEAAAYGRPMVSTRIGAEGLDFIENQEILLRDQDAGLAEACVRLLEDDAACASFGTAARRKVESLYAEPSIRRMIMTAMNCEANP